MQTPESEIGTDTIVDDLTEVHADSQLPGVHQSRHATSGFLVDGPRLKDYLPIPPSKQPQRSWIWKDAIGVGLTEKKTGKRLVMPRMLREGRLARTHLKKRRLYHAPHGPSYGSQAW